jgi:hypothetical protein
MECYFAYFVTFRKDNGQPVPSTDALPEARRLSKKVKETADAA